MTRDEALVEQLMTYANKNGLDAALDAAERWEASLEELAEASSFGTTLAAGVCLAIVRDAIGVLLERAQQEHDEAAKRFAGK